MSIMDDPKPNTPSPKTAEAPPAADGTADRPEPAETEAGTLAPVAAGQKADEVAQSSDTDDGAEAAGQASEGDRVLTELRSQIERFVVMPSSEALTAVTLWVAATHAQTAWQHAPRLAIVGPAKRCGKSRLLDVVTETVHAPLITVNASPAAIF